MNDSKEAKQPEFEHVSISLNELAEQADKVIRLIKQFNEIFPEENEQEHLKLAIMAGLSDAYKAGQKIKFKVINGLSERHNRLFGWFNENYPTAIQKYLEELPGGINGEIDKNFWDMG